MIQFIHGVLAEINENSIVCEAAGVGYGINVPASVIGKLPAVGEEVRIYTYYSVREDGQSLYGFLYREDRDMFRQLLSVNGVGPKGALGILSVLTPDDLRMAIVTGDAKAISRAPGIGAKTAQRVILDLRDRIDAEGVLNHTGGVSASDLSGGSLLEQPAEHGPIAEAIEALSSLGYSRLEAGRAVRRLAVSPDMTAEQILKLALRQL